MTTSQPATFALVPGAVAWARRDSPSASGLWWPVILYPTWATAAKESGLMDLRVTQPGGADKTKESVRLVGCKRPVSLTFLRENKVPRALVLRPRPAGAGPMARPGPQNRVVAHFLGLSSAEHAADDSVAAWGAVDMASLRPYRQDCRDVLAACRGKVGRADWIDLLRGIDEASMVLEDWTVASKELLRNVPEEKQPVGSCKKSSVTKSTLLGVETLEVNDAGNVMDDGRNDDNDNDEEEASLGQTPEFYDDWKGLGTESQSQRNTQFSQVFNFSQAQSYGEKEETTPATATEEKAKTTDEPSVEMIGEKKKDAPTSVDENADGEEASVATVKATNVSVSDEKGTEDSASKHSIGEEKSEEEEPVSVVAEEVDVDTSAPKASAMETEASIGAGKEANEVAAPLDTSTLQEDNDEEQKEEQSKEPVITQEETNDAAEVEAITVPTSTDDAAAAEFSDGEELSDYGPESQDISNMDTQPHSNLTDPACTIAPLDGAPKNLKRRSLASILGRKSKESSTNTGATTTPFVSSKGSIKKVSPSPMADAAKNATESAINGDDDLDEGLESKRLFDGNANLSEKRTIDRAGCEDRDTNAKKPRSEDGYFSAEEMDEDEGLHFFTQQG